MAHSEPHSTRVAMTTGPNPPILPVRSPLRPPARSISSHSAEDMISSPQRPDSLLSLDLEDGEANSDEGRPTSTSTGATTDSSNSTAPSSSTSMSHSSTTTGMTKRYHALHELLSSERAYASDLALIREVHIPLALGQPIPLQVIQSTTTPSIPPHSRSNSISHPNPKVSSKVSNPSLASANTRSSSGSGSGSSSYSHATWISNPSEETSATDTSLSLVSVNAPSTSVASTSTTTPATDASPPMTPEDIKVIFSNIAELALFADMFTEELELALGNVVDGGQGEDFVGKLFLRITPELERPYKHYITRHPTALQHLQNLPQTPALQAYLAYTQSVASSVSHAWDLASLLIKPVQRLLKYPLLLGAIIDETPDTHPDKDNLRAARTHIEEIARNVNEGRRRAEVVKDVLTKKNGAKLKPNAPVSVAAGVNLSKVKSLRHGGVREATMRVAGLTEGANSEAAQVERMQAELKRIDAFAQQFARNVLDWAKMQSNVVAALRTWALSFGKVIGLSADQGSEAFDAFVEVIRSGLLPLSADLEMAINEKLLKDMAHLLMTMNKPLKLLASMDEQEPYHYHLLTMPVSAKNRPPASLLAASTNYLALRGQLATELPVYLGLLHRGFAVFVRRLAEIQTRFWADVKHRWADLWEMLRVEGELNVGSEETCAVWESRWADVNEVLKALGVMHSVVPVLREKEREFAMREWRRKEEEEAARRKREEEEAVRRKLEYEEYFGSPEFYMPMSGGFMSPAVKKERKNSTNSRTTTDSRAVTVQSMVAALEPSHSPTRKRQQQQQQQSGPAVNVASTVNMLGSLNPNGAPSSSSYHQGYSASFMSGFGVSGPMPLGSGRERGRHRGQSDATSSSSASRRPSSHERVARPPGGAGGVARGTSATRRRTHVDGLAEDYLEYSEYIAVHGVPPPYDEDVHPYGRGGRGAYGHGHGHGELTRMKSMPVTSQKSTMSSEQGSTTRTVQNSPLEETSWDEHQGYQQHQHRDRGRERGRPAQTTTPAATTPATRGSSPPLPSTGGHKTKSKERGTRKRSGSVKSITSFFTSSSSNNTTTTASPHSDPDPQPLTPSQRDSWVSKPAKYVCQVIHPCKPPASVSYYSFPFFTLVEGDFYEILQEAGHPSIHPKLPLYVDDGEDCLLLCRDGRGVVGWALASFLEPVTLSG